jgi:hypothetical protein
MIISRPNTVSQRVEPRLAQGKVAGAIPTGNGIVGNTTPQPPPPFQPKLDANDLHLQNVQAIFASYSDDAVSLWLLEVVKWTLIWFATGQVEKRFHSPKCDVLSYER